MKAPTVANLVKQHAAIEKKRWALEIRREKRGGWMRDEADDVDDWQRDEDELDRLQAASKEIVKELEASGRLALAERCRWYDLRPPAEIASKTELLKWRRDLETWPRPVEDRLARELERRAEPHRVFDKDSGLYNVAVRRNQWEDDAFGRRILFAITMLRAAAKHRTAEGGAARLRLAQSDLLWWLWSYGRERIDRKLLLEQAEASLQRISESWRRKLLKSAAELAREERAETNTLKAMRAESDPLRALGVYGRRRDATSLPVDVFWATA